MSQAQSQNLVRKQYLVSSDNVSKLERLAKIKGTSATDIVRLAIDAYDPEIDGMAPDELMELVSERLKEAIDSTKKANKKVSLALKTLEVGNNG